jgi:hypothetical protein
MDEALDDWACKNLKSLSDLKPDIGCRAASDDTYVFLRLNMSIAFSCGSPRASRLLSVLMMLAVGWSATMDHARVVPAEAVTRSHPVPETGSNLL